MNNDIIFNNIKFVSSPEEISKYDSRTKFAYKCKICGKTQIISGWKSKDRLERYKTMICRLCSFKQNYPIEKANINRENTFLERYGKRFIGQIDEFKLKSKKVKLEKYGDQNYNNRDKAIKTYMDKTGYLYPMNNPEVKEKAKKTNIEKYGVNVPAKNNLILNKMKNTYKSRTGYYNPMLNPTVVELFKENNLNKYGCEHYFNSKEYKKQMIERFGIEHAIKYRYKYNGTNFDSAWELALWIYAKDHNEEIIREPVSFDYIYDGKIRKYYPDFKYEGKLIEIKGNHYFLDRDPSKRMIYPYSRMHSNSPIFTKEEKQYMDDLYEAKHQCGLKNGVEFWGKKEMEPYMKYIDSKYGSSYLAQFKLK